MAPSQRVPVSESRYRLPEKSTVPPMNNQPATRTGDPVQWFEAHATANSASAWYIWYRAPVSKTARRSGVMRVRNACAPNAPAATAMNAEIAPASANVLSIDAAAGNLHPLHAFDLSRIADEMRSHPARQAHDDCSPGCRPQPGQLESGDQPGDQRQRDAVHDQDEQPQRQDGQRKREDNENRAHERINKAEQQRRDDQRTRADERDAGKQL